MLLGVSRMIFVAVGTQLPFDRLIRTMDEWASALPGRDVFAQIAGGSYVPKHIQWARSMLPEDFQSKLEHCQLLVAHAGIGSILSALELGKPVIVLPRQAELGEHRNDHQLATAKRFGARGMVRVAQNEKELCQLLDQFETPVSETRITNQASPELIRNLRQFISQATISQRGA
ncbi:MAG: Beta,4-galactosyltransferase CpsIVG [Planctomycetaceae bacterium]|nr:Beta,4-galactosyltransferase CpsIVG [Planctomycetaceae bacterium]